MPIPNISLFSVYLWGNQNQPPAYVLISGGKIDFRISPCWGIMSPFPGGLQGFHGMCCFLPRGWCCGPFSMPKSCWSAPSSGESRFCERKQDLWMMGKQEALCPGKQKEHCFQRSVQAAWIKDTFQQGFVHLLRIKDVLLRLLSSLTFQQFKRRICSSSGLLQSRNVTGLCVSVLGLISLFSLFLMFLFSLVGS